MTFVYINEKFAKDLKEKVQNGNNDFWLEIKRDFKVKADQAMLKGPWSVTYFPAMAVSGNKHDYYSEAPYWWPDPNDPTGPYIRKDGVTRPDRFMGHRESVDELSFAILYLTYAGYYLDDQKYLDRAVELLDIWFVQSETRMNPHIKYGEAIKGITDGRAAGLIVLRQFDRIVHCLGFLSLYEEYDQTMKGLKDWFAELLEWITTSEIGLDESESGNNHATWWAAHVATYAAFTGNDEKLKLAFDHFKYKVIPEQLDDNGRMPMEIGRTRSFHYVLFNLDAMSLLCEVAYHKEVDLWSYRTEKGQGIEQAIRYILPYMDNPYLWSYPQIDGEIESEMLSFQLASLRLNMDVCTTINIKRRGDSKLIKDSEERMGPLVFMPGHPLR